MVEGNALERRHFGHSVRIEAATRSPATHRSRPDRPDDIPPDIDVPPDLPGGYDRYGFRVPAVIVSPFARPHHVSHRIRDHTAILKLIETKWNLPALTLRDANANDLLDCLNLHHPAFLEPPTLPAPGFVARPAHCTPGNPGTIPPALTSRMAPSRGFGSVPLDRFLWGTGR